MKKETLSDRPGHWSDCALFSAPATPPGACDCGGLNLAAYDSYRTITSLIPTPGSLARFVRDGELPSSVEVEDAPARRVIAVAAPPNLERSHDRIASSTGANCVDFDNAGEPPVANGEPFPRAKCLTSDVPPHNQPPESPEGFDDTGGAS